MATTAPGSLGFKGKAELTKILLACGILSSLLYFAMNIFIPPLFEGYSSASQTVSELSAIGAPTRKLWVVLGTLYILLFAAFGFGVWLASGRNRHIRIAGSLIIIYGAVNLYWPPMHLRGNEPGLTDTLHIVWSGITVLLMMFTMGFAAAGSGKAFRIYTIATIALQVMFGFLTGLTAPNIPLNLPTPMIGVWERIMIGVFLLWVMVFATILIRREDAAEENRDVSV